jgi:pyrroloquinoline quinone biosynthesis protein B
MQVKILGAAAGGGFPQWNCNCPGCQAARLPSGQRQSRSHRAKTLTQSSIAVRANNGAWLLVNASPDVRGQLEMLRSPGELLSARSNPVAGIILTDAEIDHTTGLILLRESSQPLKVYSTPSVKRALTTGYPLFYTLQNYCGVEWFPLELEQTMTLSGLDIEVLPLSKKPPKYMQDQTESKEIWGVGLTFRDCPKGSAKGDRATGGILTYTPGLAELNNSIKERFEESHCILVDGTFWKNDELPALGIGSRTASQMGHLHLSGDDGSLSQLAKLSTPRKILVHINNTNPILLPDSEERQAVEAAGIEIGYDGLAIAL